MTGPGRIPRRRTQRGVGTYVALGLLALLFVVAVALVASGTAGAAFQAAAVLALVPLIAVVAAVRWVDRWEPEPWPALAVALGWGASVAVIVALLLNTGAILVISLVSTAEDATALGAVLVAPVVEESIKGLGVLIIFGVWRRFFDGPVDGVVYAAMVAAGFAFVENILYFSATISSAAGAPDAGDAVVTVFVLRGVMSPFAHLVFTAATGLALGLAARRGGHAWVWAFPVGLVLAMVLHGAWNASAVAAGGAGFVIVYLMVHIPLFGALLGLVVWLRRREAAVLRERLTELVVLGRLAPPDVWMLTSLRRRRRARAWAREVGPAAGAAMRALQVAATRWAFQRHRTLAGRQDLHGWQDEVALLGELDAARRELGLLTGV